MRFDAPRILHLGDVLVVWLKRHSKDGEGRCLILNFDLPLVHPDGGRLACKPIFAKELPVSEPHIPIAIQISGEVGGVQNAVEHWLGIGSPQHPTQHVIWTVPTILSLSVGKMVFDVVIGHPLLMLTLYLRPSARLGKAIVREPFLDVCYVEFEKFLT